MGRWSSDPDEIRLKLAYAFGNGLDPLDQFGREWERDSA